MNAVHQHSPVILLLGKRSGGDIVDRWLEESSYRTWEAADVFQLLDQVSDFTVRNRPDVVFMHVGATIEEQDLIRSLIEAGTGEEGFRVIDLRASTSRDELDLTTMITTLKCQLDKFIPQHNASAS